MQRNRIDAPHVYSAIMHFCICLHTAVDFDVDPVRNFMVENEGAAAGEVTKTIWIGGTGVTTHTHYDVQHNFFVQVGCVPHMNTDGNTREITPACTRAPTYACI